MRHADKAANSGCAKKQNKNIDNRKSYKDSFTKCLKKNLHIRASGIPKPFVLLDDLCRIIASEWLVFNTYIERELNNIEAAKVEAQKDIDEITRDNSPSSDWSTYSIEICDQDGALLLVVPFSAN